MQERIWSVSDSKHIFGLGRGDLHFLDISERGELELVLNGHRKSLRELIEQVRGEVKGSFTLRIPQLITSQIEKLVSTFNDVAERFHFRGRYKPLYPIKVNQRKLEVSTIIKSSTFYGLEAGTKSEFIICTKMFSDERNRIIMSNGVKDDSYFELMRDALEGGYRIYISIEDITELRNAIRIIPEENLHLFFRIKPYSTVKGKWGSSSGRDSKFGLDTQDLLRSIELLKREKLEDKLIGIHSHPGSQVTDFNGLAGYAEFLSDIYVQLRGEGFENLHIINFGGGLPIDYTGRLPERIFERYFTLLFSAMERKLDKFEFPDIMTEAGRAITALSAMVLVQILEVRHPFMNLQDVYRWEMDEKREKHSAEAILRKWKETSGWKPNFQTLKQLHQTEVGLLQKRMELRRDFFRSDDYEAHLEEAGDLITPDVKALGNFSVFNSACDHVMVSQYFPVIPTEGMNKQPDTVVRLIDITCDSDGELSNFVPAPQPPILWTRDGYPLTSTTPFLLKGTPIPHVGKLWDSYLAIPLVGAYQDIVEFDHNLIGDLQDVLLTIEGEKMGLKPINTAEPIENLIYQMGYKLKVEGNPYVLDESFE